MAKLREVKRQRNLVAKHAAFFNKSFQETSKKKKLKHGKEKYKVIGREYDLG